MMVECGSRLEAMNVFAVAGLVCDGACECSRIRPDVGDAETVDVSCCCPAGTADADQFVSAMTTQHC